MSAQSLKRSWKAHISTDGILFSFQMMTKDKRFYWLINLKVQSKGNSEKSLNTLAVSGLTLCRSSVLLHPKAASSLGYFPWGCRMVSGSNWFLNFTCWKRSGKSLSLMKSSLSPVLMAQIDHVSTHIVVVGCQSLMCLDLGFWTNC